MPKIIKDEQIYQAVIQVVAERGYARATTQQIADVANISEVTLFRKFGNKAMLIKQATSYLLQKTELSSTTTYTGDIKTDLYQVVEKYQNIATEYGVFIFSLFADISRYPELYSVIEEPFNIFQSIGSLIAQYQTQGILIKEHPMHAIATLLGPLMYITIIRRENLDDHLPPIDLAKHIDQFLAGRYLE